jgi:hypothetical protein
LLRAFPREDAGLYPLLALLVPNYKF